MAKKIPTSFMDGPLGLVVMGNCDILGDMRNAHRFVGNLSRTAEC